MDLVNLNPYRILGVYANTPSDTWSVRNFEIDNIVSKPLDFTSYLRNIPRTKKLMDDALTQLKDPYERMKHAQFWFYVTTEDEEALKHIRSRDIPSALKLWSWKDTVSSLQNRMICSLILGKYKEVVRYAEHIYSHYADELIIPVVGTKYEINQNDLILNFWHGMKAEVEATDPDLLPALPPTWDKVIIPPKEPITEPVNTTTPDTNLTHVVTAQEPTPQVEVNSSEFDDETTKKSDTLIFVLIGLILVFVGTLLKFNDLFAMGVIFNVVGFTLILSKLGRRK